MISTTKSTSLVFRVHVKLIVGPKRGREECYHKRVMESKPKTQMSSLAAALAASHIKDDSSKVTNSSNNNSNNNNVNSYNSTSNNAPKSSLATYQHRSKPKNNDKVPNNIPNKGRNGDNNNIHNNNNNNRSLHRGGRDINKESGSGGRGNRGKSGRGHEQERGSHHHRYHKQQKNDTKARSKNNFETISFEFDIATMADNSQSHSSSQNESKQRQKTRNNNHSASGGKILDMRASRRLIDSALGRSRNNISKNTSNNSIVESKQNKGPSTRKQHSNDRMNIPSFEATSSNINDSDQCNESPNQIEKLTNKVVLINEKVQGSKKPVTNWADDDDGDY